MFTHLEIETQSTCNRSCKTCLRTKYPDKSKLESRNHKVQLPSETFYSIIDQAHALNYKGTICLSHYNEPLMDERILAFASYVKHKLDTRELSICTNGDFITENKVKKLDDVFDSITIALYDENADEKEIIFRQMFKKTELRFTKGQHMLTHFGPHEHLDDIINGNIDHPCPYFQKYMIISHTGDMLLCCEDFVGHWDLGNANNESLVELWYSSKHLEILKNLEVTGGRRKYEYCSSCPRP